MNKTQSVLSILLRYINNTFVKDSNYDIAEAMVKNYFEIPNMTINDLADACYVSPASISRFIRTLGFEKFAQFKEFCANTYDIDTDYSSLVTKANENEIKPIFEKYTNNVIDNIQATFKNINYEQFDRISSMINDSDDVIVLGLEFALLLGQHFQGRMALMKKQVKVPMNFEEQLEIAKQTNGSSVVFIASIEGGYLYHNSKVVQQLEKNNAKIIILTLNDNTKLVKKATEIVKCARINDNTEGRISLLYSLELILMNYCIKYNNK